MIAHTVSVAVTTPAIAMPPICPTVRASVDAIAGEAVTEALCRCCRAAVVELMAELHVADDMADELVEDEVVWLAVTMPVPVEGEVWVLVSDDGGLELLTSCAAAIITLTLLEAAALCIEDVGDGVTVSVA